MCATNASRLRMWCSMHNESKLRRDGLVQSTALEMMVSSRMRESKARVLATWMRGIEGAQDFAATARTERRRSVPIWKGARV